MSKTWKLQNREEIKEKARQMRAEDKTFFEIARALGVSQTTVRYWVDPTFRARLKEKSRERSSRIGNPNQSSYRKQRYASDPEFRSRVLENTKRSRSKRRLSKANGVNDYYLPGMSVPRFARAYEAVFLPEGVHSGRAARGTVGVSNTGRAKGGE